MSASTLGRWPIVLAVRARGELRLLAEDKNTFDMVHKLGFLLSNAFSREISHGRFTTDNHLPVRGGKPYIQIYRARLGNDLRIIYLIDLESDGFNQYDHQFSSRARVVYDFWVKVSKFLKRRGSEYRSRCIRRATLNTRDGPLCTPSSFLHNAYIPLTAAEPELEGEGRNLAWGESELNEVRDSSPDSADNTLHSLEKYIPVTKSLYNSSKYLMITYVEINEMVYRIFAKNLMGVKNQTSQAWATFIAVKSSGILPESEEFMVIKSLVSSGRDVVARNREAAIIPGHNA
ncbi:hypothetical protein B0J17DRAFT_628579 [Rhizoctonia solani]|nr:hypothetical protein B0J17DRAFT_628579 [Rhizoctonia solani]